MPISPLTGDLGAADLAVLERFADQNVLAKVGLRLLSGLIARASNNHQDESRAGQWLVAAHDAFDLRAGHDAVAFSDLAEEVATEVRLLRAVQAELAHYGAAREEAYRYVDTPALARALPGLKEVGGPALVTCMSEPGRSRTVRSERQHTEPSSPRRILRDGELTRQGDDLRSGATALLTARLPKGTRLPVFQRERESVDRLGRGLDGAPEWAGSGDGSDRRASRLSTADKLALPRDPTERSPLPSPATPQGRALCVPSSAMTRRARPQRGARLHGGAGRRRYGRRRPPAARAPDGRRRGSRHRLGAPLR